MSEKEARAFITQVAPLGTMDYSLLHKRPPSLATGTIKKITDKPLSGCPPPVFQGAQAHPTCYVSTYYTTTEDYPGHARSPCSRNPPGADDKNLEGTFFRTLNWPTNTPNTWTRRYK